ncbi:hypothetical protein J7E73_20300 [Paenibacillus albidus]|uniref:leucine-rich repeat domain-containing protein n=1 Tax=Paenibacillus albidus TaxID=2041023 RepID=UPI001BE562BD|nr:leucine-rich repeat domain-containing protein [Paenibacillus albidus]MBT2291421.1 hypothetical protein [Paenibacillus albidus]
MKYNFDGKGLTETPAIVYETQNLTELSLYNNQITEIPERLFIHDTLEVLNYAGNNIEMLSEEVGRLVHLRMLDLGLPDSITQISSLRELHVYGNHLISLPEHLGALEELRVLDANDNRLTELPPSLGKLGKLRRLSFRKNKISQLPEEIGALDNLIELDLRDNLLRDLPDSILRLERLEKLDLRWNHHLQTNENLEQLEQRGCIVYR